MREAANSAVGSLFKPPCTRLALWKYVGWRQTLALPCYQYGFSFHDAKYHFGEDWYGLHLCGELTRQVLIMTIMSCGYLGIHTFIGHFVFGLLLLLFLLGLAEVHGMRGPTDLFRGINGFSGVL